MIISKTPLRMSFFGGGTDFSEYYKNSKFGYGSTISTTLNMYVYITVNKRFDDKIRVVYNGNELVNYVDEIQHNIIRNALKIVGIDKGIEIIYMADIPISTAGIGLSSSSALAVGVLNALHAYKGEHATAEQLAREACHIEIDLIGQKIGIQDQFAVANGGFNRYRFFKDDSVKIEPVICKEEYLHKLSQNLMLFFTGQTRDSRKILQEQSETIAEKMNRLDSLVESVDLAYKHLCDGKIDEWGYALDKTWRIKKSLSTGISNTTIDDMYEKALKNGAIGGKILGAGGGGFLLIYAPHERQDTVAEALKNYRQVDFNFESMGSHIIFTD